MPESSVHINTNSHIYPGEYSPLPFDVNQLNEELHFPAEAPTRPVSNVMECPDHYEIEIVAPGHSKDDFIVTVDAGHLAVFAVRRRMPGIEPSRYRSQEFNYDCFEFSLRLPEDIDSDFAVAEYQAGILRVSFPRTEQPGRAILHRIIVY